MAVFSAAGAAGLGEPGEICTEACHAHHVLGLPPFDARVNHLELPGLEARRGLEKLHASDAWARRQAALARLRADIPDLACSDHPLFGTPSFLRSTSRFLTPPSKADAPTIVREYLIAQADLVEIDVAELDKGRVTRDYVTHAGLMRHFTWQQMHDGLDLVGCEVRANVTGRGELINLSVAMVPRPAADFEVPAAVLSALDAIRLAAGNAGITLTTDPTPATPQEGASLEQTWNNGPDFRADEPIVTRRVLYPMSRENIRPAWAVFVPVHGVGHGYDILIDAVDGRPLRRDNRLVSDTTEPVTYRVYPLDGPAPGSPGNLTPNGFQFPFVPRALLTVDPLDIAPYSPNGWIPDGGSTTTGNNVDAYLDAVAPANEPDPNGRPVAANRVFDLPIVVDANNMPTQAPGNYGLASVTHAFYHVNKYHDALHRFGFDEVAGNFQTDNFGRGGTGGDHVRMELQDGSGTNNANWSSTGTDGSFPRCQMYVFTGPTPDRDGSLDTEIIYHELSHGLSIRLHGGLTGTQGRSMGEGWGDFFGICLNAEETDNLGGTFTTGGHTTYLLWSGYDDNYYSGIRRFPYSTDMSKNPQTFEDIDTAQQAYPPDVPRNTNITNTANAVHNAGEVWCCTLIDARYHLSLDLDFAANDIIMQLVVDGMKLAPGAPNFLEERDGILQSDLVRYGGAHQSRLWQAFARRGMGYSATSPTGGTTAGIVEAYDTPQAVHFSYPDGLPSQLQPGEPFSFRVEAAPFNLTITPDSAELFYSTDNVNFSSVDLVPIGVNQYSATLPGFECFANVRFYVQVGTSAGIRRDPASAPSGAFESLVFESILQPVLDTMESDTGWVVGPNTATTGIWGRMDPEATGAQPGDDTTPGDGTQCWVTDGRAGTAVGTFDVDGGGTLLTSPVYDLSGGGDFAIEYMRWYSTNTTTTYGDPFLVEITTDGSTWHVFESLPVGTPVQLGWTSVTRSLSQLGLTPSSHVQLRFLAQDLPSASIVEAAIDDVRVYRYVCQNPPACDPDVNCDGSPDQGDVACMILAVAGDTSCICQNPDFNLDGSADQGDVAALIGVVAGQPCP